MSALQEQSAPSVRIRLATAADTDFILSLVPRFAAFELPKGRRKREVLATLRVDVERTLHEPSANDHFFIAENGRGTRTGFLHLRLQRDFLSGAVACHVSNLGVSKRHEGQGIGRTLLDHAQKWAEQNRCQWMTLSVFLGNTRARMLYEKAGFDTELLRMSKSIGRGAAAPSRTRDRKHADVKSRIGRSLK